MIHRNDNAKVSNFNEGIHRYNVSRFRWIPKHHTFFARRDKPQEIFRGRKHTVRVRRCIAKGRQHVEISFYLRIKSTCIGGKGSRKARCVASANAVHVWRPDWRVAHHKTAACEMLLPRTCSTYSPWAMCVLLKEIQSQTQYSVMDQSKAVITSWRIKIPILARVVNNKKNSSIVAIVQILYNTCTTEYENKNKHHMHGLLHFLIISWRN